jgi:hypothetical protein
MIEHPRRQRCREHLLRQRQQESRRVLSIEIHYEAESENEVLRLLSTVVGVVQSGADAHKKQSLYEFPPPDI